MILPLTIWVCLHSNFSGGQTIFNAKTRLRLGRSRSSKVIDFGTNQKRVCDFLLVRHSNFDPILHRYRDIAGFCAHDPTPIPLLFWVFPFAPDRPCSDQPERKP